MAGSAAVVRGVAMRQLGIEARYDEAYPRKSRQLRIRGSLGHCGSSSASIQADVEWAHHIAKHAVIF